MKITLRPTYKQHLAYEALKTKKVVFFGGGAGGGKSWSICESRLVNALRFPGYKSFIGREELKRLMQSTFITFSKVCHYHNIPRNNWKLDGKYNVIRFRNGSSIDLLDLRYLPSDPLYERYGSLEYTDGAIEEAGEVHFKAFDTLKSRINRHLNEEYDINPTILITGNPKKNWTYREFYLPYRNGKLPDNYAFIQSLYNENPHTSKSYEKQLMSITDKNLKARLKDGLWEYDDDPTTMIDYENISAIWHNDHVKGGKKYIIADVARYGADKAVITVWDGFIVVDYVVMDISKTQDIVNCIRVFRDKYQVSIMNCLADEAGVGGGVVDMCNIKGFVANRKPVVKTYNSIKDECGYKLANIMRDNKIYFMADISDSIKDRIESELEQLKSYEPDKDNKLRILPKEKIKENIGHSPDWLDVFLMRCYYEIKPKGVEIY